MHFIENIFGPINFEHAFKNIALIISVSGTCQTAWNKQPGARSIKRYKSVNQERVKGQRACEKFHNNLPIEVYLN